jgi:hypothetical protein
VASSASTPWAPHSPHNEQVIYRIGIYIAFLSNGVFLLILFMKSRINPIFSSLGILILLATSGSQTHGSHDGYIENYIDGTWKVTEMKCREGSVKSFLSKNTFLRTIRRSTGYSSQINSGCTLIRPEAYTYPIPGKITIETSGLTSELPLGCSGKPPSMNFDSRLSQRKTYWYHLARNTLVLTEEGNQACLSLGKSGQIQITALRQ